MNILDIKNNVKICSELNASGVTKCVVIIPQEKLITTLTKISNKDVLAALPEQAQLTILQNLEAKELFEWAVLVGGVKPSRIGVLFEDFDITKQYLKVDKEYLKKVLLNTKIPEELIGLMAQHPDLEQYNKLDDLLINIQAVKTVSDISLEWLYQNRDLISKEMCRSQYLLGINNVTRVLEDIATDQNLMDVLVRIFEVNKSVKLTNDVFVQLKEQTESIKSKLNKVLNKLPAEVKCDFIYYWLENEQLLYDLSCITKRLDDVSSGGFCKNRVKYIAFCYKEVAEYEVMPWQENLVIYAIANKKKSFLKLLRENAELLKTVNSNSVLLKPAFYKSCVNLNTVSVTDFKSLAVLRASDGKLESLSNRGLTPKEFLTLYTAGSMYITLYTQLSEMNVDYRLSVIREFINNKVFIAEESIESIAEFLKKKKLSEWKLGFKHIKNIDYSTTVKLLLCYDDVKHFISDISNKTEALRLCQNKELYKNMNSLQEVRESVFETDRDWLELKAKLKLSDDFVDENKERILEFIMQEGAYIIYRYVSRYPKLLEDMRKLLSAELLGKFREVKYHNGDLEREIDMSLREDLKEHWKENTSLELSDMKVWEEDAFLSVMQIGELPRHTCLSWKDGTYSDCLLSNFDSNKKVIFVSKGEQVICRAMVRLTKGSVRSISPRKFEFADLGKEQNFVKDKTQLVLFLETPYLSNAYTDSKAVVFKLMWSLLRKKASEMGVILLCSDAYKNWQSILTRINYHFYITASKAGRQYLDSFGGERVAEDECKYYCTEALVMKDDVNKLADVEG